MSWLIGALGGVYSLSGNAPDRVIGLIGFVTVLIRITGLRGVLVRFRLAHEHRSISIGRKFRIA